MPATGTSPEIPLFDLRLDPEDVEAVMEVLRSGWLTMGPRIAEFEQLVSVDAELTDRAIVVGAGAMHS